MESNQPERIVLPGTNEQKSRALLYLHVDRAQREQLEEARYESALNLPSLVFANTDAETVVTATVYMGPTLPGVAVLRALPPTWK